VQKNLLPVNVNQMTKLTLVKDQQVSIQISQVLLLMPIFRWNEIENLFVDATGDYDLCMSENGLAYYLTSKRPGTTVFAYRYVSTYFPASAMPDLTRRHGSR